jgi:hypothetical protein
MTSSTSRRNGGWLPGEEPTGFAYPAVVFALAAGAAASKVTDGANTGETTPLQMQPHSHNRGLAIQ